MSGENTYDKDYIQRKLGKYKEIFAKAAVGDFSSLAPIEDTDDDEFAQLAAGINILIEVVKRRVNELEDSYHRISEEEARLIASINSLASGFVIFDSDKGILVANRNISKILGLNSLQVDFNQLAAKLASFNLELNYQEAIIHNKVSELREMPLGSKFLRTILSPVNIDEGDHTHTIGAVLYVEDVTEQRNLDQSKKDFISLASHEMRTPLAIIKGDIELLRNSPTMKEAPAQIKEFLNDANDNCDRLFHILDDFLDVVNLERGTVLFKLEKFDLVPIIRETIESLRTAAATKKLYLKFSGQGNPNLRVLADKEHTRQILINLINNAIHYTNEGGIEISVENGDKTKKIYIADTGIGIPEDKKSFLFQKFGTVSRTFIQTKEYGSGLGLYICKLLAESMNGRVTLEKSAPGAGSVFSVELPSA